MIVPYNRRTLALIAQNRARDMSTPSLTIGIPTFNGAKYIAEAIDSVLIQLADIPDQSVETIISDNASTDNTAEIVGRFAQSHSGLITYHVNPQNIGYDRNVDNLFKLAHGEYLWLLGDDDMLVPGSLKRWFSTKQKQDNVAIFLFPHSTLDINTGRKTWCRQFTEDIICKNGDQFLQTSVWGSAALSSLCIRTAEWNSKDISRYFGSQWVHIGGVIEVMAGPQKGYIFADEFVIVRVSNPRWNSNGNQLKLGFAHLDVFENVMSRGYDKKTFECFVNRRYAGNLRDILVLRPAGIASQFAIAKRMIHFFKRKPGFWLFHLPLLFVPTVLTSPIIDLLKRAIKKLGQFNSCQPLSRNN